MNDHHKVLASNRKARHTYHILEREVAGMELLGTEVKAIRAGKINIKEGYVAFVAGEAFLVGCHVGSYDNAGYATHDPVRRRRLLLQKREIERLAGKVFEERSKQFTELSERQLGVLLQRQAVGDDPHRGAPRAGVLEQLGQVGRRPVERLFGRPSPPGPSSARHSRGSHPPSSARGKP